MYIHSKCENLKLELHVNTYDHLQNSRSVLASFLTLVR